MRFGNYISEVVRFKSTKYLTRFINCHGSRVKITEGARESKDGEFKLIPGLYGRGIILQSARYPDYVIRRRDVLFHLDKMEYTKEFMEDATLVPVLGLSNNRYSASFHLARSPDIYLKHAGFRVQGGRVVSAADEANSSFEIVGTYLTSV